MPLPFKIVTHRNKFCIYQLQPPPKPTINVGKARLPPKHHITYREEIRLKHKKIKTSEYFRRDITIVSSISKKLCHG